VKVEGALIFFFCNLLYFFPLLLAQLSFSASTHVKYLQQQGTYVALKLLVLAGCVMLELGALCAHIAPTHTVK
jgi:hypothetical protein